MPGHVNWLRGSGGAPGEQGATKANTLQSAKISIKTIREGSEKPSLLMLVFLRKAPGDIPTPPRATTKLFDAVGVTTPPGPGEERRGIECAGH